MKQMRSFKTEIAPNNKQRTLLVKTAGVARFAWNWGLARRIDEYAKTKKSSSAITQHKQLNELKAAEFPWMYEVSKCAPQEALRNLDLAFAAFYRRVKNGEKPGFPKFKSKRLAKPSFRINAKIEIVATAIRIPKIGWVRLKEYNYIPRTGLAGFHQLSVTVSSEGGRWFVSAMFELTTDIVDSITLTKTIGIDVGLKEFAVTSEGERFAHPKLLKKMARKLKRLQRKVSRRTKGGANRKKAVRAVQVQHYRVACQRKDFLHKLTSYLVKTKPEARFIVEDLNVAGMMKNHKLARGISDSGWGEFSRQLAYKAGEDRFGKADRWFPSSKMCSCCHRVMDSLDLSIREWVCPKCGAWHDRDVNAATNLSRYEQYVADGVYRPRSRRELPASSAGSHACGERGLEDASSKQEESLVACATIKSFRTANDIE